MRVLFWGTPEFAAPPLRALLGEGFDVVGVVTQPDSPQGRSRSTLVASPVKQIALEEALPVLQPEKPRGAEFLDAAARARARHLGRRRVRPHPPARSDRPAAARHAQHPRVAAARSGAARRRFRRRSAPGTAETGVTIMRMVPALDAGPILLQVPTPIVHDETYGELQLRLSELGALALIEALALLDIGADRRAAAGRRARDVRAQDRARRCAHRLDAIGRDYRRRDSRVRSEAGRVHDARRGGGEAVRRARGVAGHCRQELAFPLSGTVLAIDDAGAVIACGDGVVRITDAQPAGKRRLTHRRARTRPFGFESVTGSEAERHVADAHTTSDRVPLLHAVTNDEIVLRADFVDRAGRVMHAGGARVAVHLRAPRLGGR